MGSWNSPTASGAAPRTSCRFASVRASNTCSSQASRSPSLDPKWWITRPGETSAASAIERTVARANPRSANNAMAASRIRAAVSGAAREADVERMFNIKHAFNQQVKISSPLPLLPYVTAGVDHSADDHRARRPSRFHGRVEGKRELIAAAFRKHGYRFGQI